jgi:hypothetical protein
MGASCHRRAERGGDGETRRAAVSSFLLVAHGQDGDGIRVDAISHRIAAVTKVDHPFPEFIRHVLDGATDVWLMRK